MLLAIDCSAAALEPADAMLAQAAPIHASATCWRMAYKAPLASRSADRLYADMPFGHHIGSHENNERLYPAILREAARLARP